VDEHLRVACELNQWALRRLTDALADLGDDEIDWRPLPESNSINVIVRHLRIEAQWHLDSLQRGEALPSDVTPDRQKEIDAVPLDCRANLEQFARLYATFIEVLEATTLNGLRRRTSDAYGNAAASVVSAHFLGYHQALHVTTHSGQIRTIRNLYQKTRGRRARFFPDNPTYPAS
jgi:uncharacterized damage-inducible protein DinB